MLRLPLSILLLTYMTFCSVWEGFHIALVITWSYDGFCQTSVSKVRNELLCLSRHLFHYRPQQPRHSTKQCSVTSQPLIPHQRLFSNYTTEILERFEPWGQEQPTVEETEPWFSFPRQVCEIKDNHFKAEVVLTAVPAARYMSAG